MKIQRILAVFIFFVATGALLAQDRRKLAQTGMKFLSVPTDARGSALGDAATAIEGNAASVFFNPASMAHQEIFATANMGRVQWIADIDYFFGSLALSPGEGRFGVFGFFVHSVDYGDFQGTIRAENDQGFIDTDIFSPAAIALGVSYAKALTNKFSIGGNVKFVSQDLGSGIIDIGEGGVRTTDTFKADVLAFDLGILYRTGFKSLNFGMTVRNFSQEVTFIDEGFQLPLTFKIGVAMNVLDLTSSNDSNQALLLSIDASHPRDFAEQLSFGGEYLFAGALALRAGYSFPNDEHGFTTGAGFKQQYKDYGLGLDYAYTPFGLFDAVHRFSLSFSF